MTTNMPEKSIKSISNDIYTICSTLYYSGFCLTDNKNFSEFWLFKIPRLGYPFKSFKFGRRDMNFIFEEMEITPKKISNSVLLGNLEVDKTFVMYFINKYGKDITYRKVKKSFNKINENLVGVFKDGKNIGILKGTII